MEAHEELEESIHHARQPFDKGVAGATAIIAALLALVSVAGQHFNTEQLLMQGRASDEWAYYQAKDIRRFTAEATRDIMLNLKPPSPSETAYDQSAKKYRGDAERIEERARDFERERDRAGNKANRFHFGEVFLEIAIVLSSLSILTKTKLLFFAGVFMSAIGLVIAVSAAIL
jgi:hypothetical protein